MSYEYSIGISEVRSDKSLQIQERAIQDGYSISLLCKKVFSFAFAPQQTKTSNVLTDIRKNGVTFRTHPRSPDDSRIVYSPNKFSSSNVSIIDETTKIVIPRADQSDFVQEVQDLIDFTNPKGLYKNLELPTMEQQKNIGPEHEYLRSASSSLMDLSPKNKINRNKMEEFTQNVIENGNLLQEMTKCPQYLNLIQCLTLLEQGQIEQAKQGLVSVMQDCDEHIPSVNRDSIVYKILLVVQLQSICYQGQVARITGRFDDSLQQMRYLYQSLLHSITKKYLVSDPLLLGQIQEQMIQFSDALNYYQKALVIFETMLWRAEVATCLNRIAIIFSYFKKYDDAKKIGFASLQMAKEIYTQDLKSLSDAYECLGEIFFRTKEYEYAELYLNLSIELKERYSGPSHPSNIKSLNFMGMIAHLKGQPQQAAIWYQRAVEIYGDDKFLIQGQLLNNLGLAYQDLSNFDAADKCYRRALGIYRGILGEGHPLIKRAKQNYESFRELEMVV